MEMLIGKVEIVLTLSGANIDTANISRGFRKDVYRHVSSYLRHGGTLLTLVVLVKRIGVHQYNYELIDSQL